MKKPLTITIKDKRDFKKVPTKFFGLVGHQQLGQTLIILDGDVEDVLTSKDIEKFLDKTKFKDDFKYTILTPEVTIEAEKMILEKGLSLIQLNSNFGWTDETYSQRKERMHSFIVGRRQQLFQERQESDD